MVKVMLEHDEWKMIRILMCQSAINSYMASSTVTRLGLPTHHVRGQRCVNLHIKPRHDRPSVEIRFDAIVTADLPRRPYADPIIEDPTSDFRPSTLADADPRGNDPIDLEIGGNVYAYLREEETIPTGVGVVTAFKTSLGYVFAGPVNDATRGQPQ